MSNNNEILERKDIPEEYKWDLESMYSSIEEWEKDYNRAKEMANEFESYKGKVASSSDNLYKVLETQGELYRLVETYYAYTHMKLDEDTRRAISGTFR